MTSKLTYEQRQLIKAKRNEKARAELPANAFHNRPNNYTKEYFDRAKERHRKRNYIIKLASTGLRFIDDKEFGIECVHCGMLSSKLQRSRHKCDCPQIPIEPVLPTHLEKKIK